jgi:predicted metalloprotease with PDZ domain
MRHLRPIQVIPFLLLPLAIAGEAPPARGPASAALAAPTATAPAAAWLGVGLDEVDEALAYHLGLGDDLGVLIAEVAPGTPAQQAGLRRFDVVTAIDDRAVYTPRAFRETVATHRPGDRIGLTVRRGAETVRISAVLVARPAEAGPAVRPLAMDPPQDFQSLLERLRERRSPGAGSNRGRVEQPDGSVMEWSVEEQPPKNDGKSF